MSVTEADAPATATQKPARKEWHWQPEEPPQLSPLFSWPPRPVEAIKFVARSWVRLSEQLIFALMAVAVWFCLQPPLEAVKEFEFGWIAQVYARNLALMLLVAGGLHLYLYTYRKQGDELKFDPRDLARKARSFTFGNQVYDNMFWSIASGVTQWTIYECLILWAMANGYAPVMTFAESPVLFLGWFLFVPIFTSMHFYFVHRFLHWPPLYRIAHALHHRNANVGPWSGLSMHPIEHVLYLSSALIHLVLASHPIHLFYHMYWNTLGAATTHSGYEGLLVKDKNQLELGSFYHQLHHRYFECNYGNPPMPWDKWFGSFHDGSPEATERVKERRRRMHGTA